MGIWSDLKERRITQIVLTYLAAGWVVLAGVDQLADRAVVPEIVYRLTLVGYVAGIPASLIIGWFHGERGRQRVSVLEVALLTVVAIGGLGGGYLVYNDYQVAQAATDVGSSLELRDLAVLYFETPGQDGEYGPVAEGLTETLIERLSQVRGLDVVSANGVDQYRDSSLPLDSIARALDVGTIIRGSLGRDGDQVRATVRLIDGESGQEIERTGVAWEEDQVLAARDTLATEVSRILRRWLGEEILLRKRKVEADNQAAWLLAQRGAHAMREGRSAMEAGDPGRARTAFRRADSLYAAAAEADPDWSEPTIERGWIAFRRHQLADELRTKVERIREAITYADDVLSRDAVNAEALELRGTARYRLVLYNLAGDPEERERRLSRAREDLETAVEADPTLAYAHSILAHLYYQTGDVHSAVLAARRAYEEDAYLRRAPQVLWRLFHTSYDLEDYGQAERWCDEGRRRFPEELHFVECRLWLQTMAPATPRPDEVWELHEKVVDLAPEGRKELQARVTRMVAGGILGRAGMRDSATTVMREARAGAEIDPARDLLITEAAMRSIIGDEDEAIDLLTRYFTANPETSGLARGLQSHWWWENIRSRPEFERLRQMAGE